MPLEIYTDINEKIKDKLSSLQSKEEFEDFVNFLASTLFATYFSYLSTQQNKSAISKIIKQNLNKLTQMSAIFLPKETLQ